MTNTRLLNIIIQDIEKYISIYEAELSQDLSKLSLSKIIDHKARINELNNLKTQLSYIKEDFLIKENYND